MEDKSESSAALEVSLGDVVRPATGTLLPDDPVALAEPLIAADVWDCGEDVWETGAELIFDGTEGADELAKYHQPRSMIMTTMTTHMIIFEFFDIFFKICFG